MHTRVYQDHICKFTKLFIYYFKSNILSNRKWFLKNLKAEGLPRMLDGFADKSAYAMCIITYMREGLDKPILFVGKTPV
jgi:inosine/xanthosine triphosphate pyrophosphatase family protein